MAISLESFEKIHNLLDSLSEQFPESIRVFRSADGVPLAFMAGLLFYKETMAFLEPFIPNVLDSCFPQEAKLMEQLPLEEADTYYQLLAAAAISDPHCSFFELNGILVSDSLSRNSAAGMRSVLVTKLEETNDLLLKLGFQIRTLTDLPVEHPSYRAYVHELDLRNLDFGEYVLAFLKTSAIDRQKDIDLDLINKDIQDAISLVPSSTALERSELALKLYCSGPDLQHRLQRILANDPPFFPLDKRKQMLLQLMCETPTLARKWQQPGCISVGPRTIVLETRHWMT